MTAADAQRVTDTMRRTVDQIEAVARAWRLLEECDADDLMRSDAFAIHGEAVLQARSTFELPDVEVDEPIADGLEDRLDAGIEDALDTYVTGRRNYGGEWDIQECVVVITTGGPHIQIEYDGRDAYVHGWDWFGAGKQRLELTDDAAAYLNRVYALDLLMEDS